MLLLVAVGMPSSESARRRKDKKVALAPIVTSWNDVAMQGELGWFARSDGLVALDFTDPANPREAGRLEMRFPVYGITLDGDIAYIAAGSHGVFTADLSDPEKPEILEWFDTPGSVSDVQLRDQLAFVVDDAQGLKILDYSYRGEPRQIASVSTRDELAAVAIDGNRLATAERTAGVRLFDLSRGQGNPLRTDELRRAEGAVDVLFLGDLLLVARERQGVDLYRVDSRGRARLTGRLETKHPARRLTRFGHRVLVSYGAGGVDVVDLTHPEQPETIGSLQLPRGYPVWRLDVAQSTGFIASLESGFGVIDLAIPDRPATVLPRKRPMRIYFP